MGYEIINVKQGYAKCSICVVSDNAIITADKGIAKAAIQNRIDVLEITRLDNNPSNLYVLALPPKYNVHALNKLE